MRQKAVVYGLDHDGRVLASRELDYETRADLITQLGPEIDTCASIEVWAGAVCVLRLPAKNDAE